MLRDIIFGQNHRYPLLKLLYNLWGRMRKEEKEKKIVSSNILKDISNKINIYQ